MWRRYDHSEMNRVNLYPGAMTVMIPRILMFAWIMFWGLSFCRIVNIGQDSLNSDKPLKGFRKTLTAYFVWFTAYSTLLVCGIHVSNENVQDVDYSKYLGKDYKF